MPTVRQSVNVGLALLLSLLVFALSHGGPSALNAEPMGVECLRVGVGSVAASLISISDGMLTVLRDGSTNASPLDEFREIIFEQAARARRSQLPPPWTIWADGGAVLLARRMGGGSTAETVSVVGYGWECTGLPLASVRAIAGRRVLTGSAVERAAFDKARGSPPVSEDELLMAGDDGERPLPCVVEAATEAGLQVSVGTDRMLVPWDKVRWAVLAPGARPKAEPAGHFVELADGTSIRVRSLEVSGGLLTAQDGFARYVAGTGGPNPLARVRVYSDSYRYLSDLEPEGTSLRPLLDVVWPPQMDRAVSGEPIAMAGRTYPKGIGMHTQTEMTFRLRGAYRRFYADIGVDDAGKAAGGQAAFKVVGDGRPLHDSGPLTAGYAPQSLSLDVAGVDRLTLMADFSSPVAAGCFADWADARVVK